MDARFNGFADLRQLLLGQPPDPLFLGFKMHKQNHRKEIKHGWNECDLDDLKIGGLGKFGHQKGAGPHNRRHELPAG